MSLGAVLFVGEYQLRNLIKNQVQFLYFDLRAPNIRVREKPDHALFRSSQSVPESSLIAAISEQALTKEHPVVLICENGEKSMNSARELEKLGYTNVFVLRGGTETLDLSAD